MNRLRYFDASWIKRLPQECQTWQYQYQLRAKELDLLLTQLKLPALDRVLEMGSGNGFQSVLLSTIARYAIASDLPDPNWATHTIGLEKSRRLFTASGQANLAYVGCSGATLPFADHSVDLVFSAYVLEHLTAQDRLRALQEAYRVLTDDGLLLTVVPSFMERVYYPLIYYPSFVIQILDGAFRVLGLRNGPERSLDANDDHPVRPLAERTTAYDVSSGVVAKLRRFFCIYHPTFPMPKPHGEFHSWWEELLACRPGQWLALHESSGFRVERTFCTILLPINLVTAWSRRIGTALYENSADALHPLATREPFKRLGLNFVIVARKA